MEGKGLLFRDYEREYAAKRLQYLYLFRNEDLDDCVRPLSSRDLDPSLRTLRHDPYKQVLIPHNHKE